MRSFVSPLMFHLDFNLASVIAPLFCLIQVRTRMIEMVSKGMATLEVGDIHSLISYNFM